MSVKLFQFGGDDEESSLSKYGFFVVAIIFRLIFEIVSLLAGLSNSESKDVLLIVATVAHFFVTCFDGYMFFNYTGEPAAENANWLQFAIQLILHLIVYIIVLTRFIKVKKDDEVDDAVKSKYNFTFGFMIVDFIILLITLYGLTQSKFLGAHLKVVEA